MKYVFVAYLFGIADVDILINIMVKLRKKLVFPILWKGGNIFARLSA